MKKFDFEGFMDRDNYKHFIKITCFDESLWGTEYETIDKKFNLNIYPNMASLVGTNGCIYIGKDTFILGFVDDEDFDGAMLALKEFADSVNSEEEHKPNDKGGLKFDVEKLDYTLLPFKELEETVKVLEFGAKKYSRENWKLVEKDRYVKALLRHVIAYTNGENNDPESNFHHLSHAICNCLFLLSKKENK